MDSVYGEEDYYYGKCGELFLTVKGNIAFHCTLCENRYKNFQEYNDHISLTHCGPDIKEELTTDFMNEEDNLFDPLSEESFPIHAGSLIIKEDEEIQAYTLPEQLVHEDLRSPKTVEPAQFSLKTSNLPEKKVRINLKQSQASDMDSREENIVELIELPAEISTIKSNLSVKETIRPNLRTINVKTTIKDRKYKCPHCSFTGADKSNMRGHIRRHSMNKPHKCTECSKTFHTRTELNTHLRSHTGERPFLCTLCGRAFSTSSKLCSHQKRHSNTRDKECSICKMRFYDLETLRGHMVVHSDKRGFKCDQCDASFKVSLALKNHLKLHENKREYQCRFCESSFNQHAGLYSHMKNCHTVVFNSFKMATKNGLDK